LIEPELCVPSTEDWTGVVMQASDESVLETCGFEFCPCDRPTPWSQRTGLTTFTLVPHRNRVIGAIVVASVTVGAASMLFALAVGAVGNLVGTAITGTEQIWDVTVARALQIVLGGLICLLTGTRPVLRGVNC
jgi:hypothetical protein